MSEPSTWSMFLTQTDNAERVALLPAELKRSLEDWFEAVCDLAQETYASPYGGDATSRLGAKIQASNERAQTSSTTRNPEFARYLDRRLVHRLNGMRTEIRKMLCFDETPRSGARFGRRKKRNA